MSDIDMSALQSACLFALVTQNYGNKVHIRKEALEPFLKDEPPAVSLKLREVDEKFYELSINDEPSVDDADIPY